MQFGSQSNDEEFMGLKCVQAMWSLSCGVLDMDR